MAEFVNLDDIIEEVGNFNSTTFQNIPSNDDLDIIPYSPINILNVEPQDVIIDGKITPLELTEVPTESLYELDLVPEMFKEELEQLFISESCDVSRTFGNSDDSAGAFKIVNLFAELITEYQKAVARQNLGIADDYALLWGNIKGTIEDQLDLQNLIINSNNNLITEINLLLARWGYDLSLILDGKASISSPNFIGNPTVPMQPLSDHSNKIASTEWVTEKIANELNTNLRFLNLSTTYMFYGDSPVNIICTWDYNATITEQFLNGVPLDVNIRTYTLSNVNSSTIVNLRYVVGGETFNKYVEFQKVYPIYVGKVSNYSTMTKIKDRDFIITCNSNEYLYIYLPNEPSARISVDNLVGGFTQVGTITILGLTYYIYKTFNSGLGKLYVNIL